MKKRILAALTAVIVAFALVSSCAKSPSSTGPPPPDEGHPGMDLVSGGTVMTSTNYRVVLTTGQGPGGNGVLTSTNYRIIGGVVGATQ